MIKKTIKKEQTGYLRVERTKEVENKYSFLPIRYEGLEHFYQTQKNVFWTPAEIDFSNDRNDWDRLDDSTKIYIKFLLFLFAQLDGIVNENLVNNFKKETSEFCKEIGFFYAIQEAVEVIHNETYSIMIKTFIRDLKEQNEGLNSIEHYPEIKKIAEWAFEWMKPEKPLGERIIAFMCIEGIIFSSAFAGIYWLKRIFPGKLNGLIKANEWIARDEGTHVGFGLEMFKTALKQGWIKSISQNRVKSIIKSAVEVTEHFTRNAMKVHLVGLTADSMVQYVYSVADYWCNKLIHKKIYNVENPFDWMLTISLVNKSNFFEVKVTEYARQKHDENFDFNPYKSNEVTVKSK